jgi:hypothetical protein
MGFRRFRRFEFVGSRRDVFEMASTHSTICRTETLGTA